jgi:hypothetical protein
MAVGCTGSGPVAYQKINNAATSTLPQVVPPPVNNLTPPPSGKQPQFVVMAFDGSRSLDMWQNTLDFAQEMSQAGHPVHFTYFLSGVYFLNWRKANSYLPPQKPAGTSLIGFADSNLDVEKRVAFVNRALAEGHEIGSHLNGHFDGSKWTLQDWQQEFSQFNNLIFNIAPNNDVDPLDAGRYNIHLSQADMIGFRAPDLGKNNAMYQVLKDNGYAYDTSGVGKATDWPKKLPNGLWEFPLAQINYATSTSKILSMDYNFYFKQSAAKDVAKQGDEKWNKFFNDTYTSYINYFNQNYQGGRAPVFIGSHFSEWNDGAYWEAMKKFAQDVCVQPEVKCVDFKELMDYLNTRDNK